jgi:hypothetical protein
MRSATARLAILLASGFIVGAIAFAVAEGAQAPRASQIPTVVTDRSALPGDVTPARITSGSASATQTAVGTHAATTKTGTQRENEAASPDRVMVTPVVRDVGDGDEGPAGSAKSDSDGDESGGGSGKSTSTESKSESSGSSSGESKSGSTRSGSSSGEGKNTGSSGSESGKSSSEGSSQHKSEQSTVRQTRSTAAQQGDRASGSSAGTER